MPPSSRIPPLLQPYTALPTQDSIVLTTSTLGASSNWLLIRFLCEALGRTSSSYDENKNDNADTKVILVSWMRDWEFWKSEARKGGGLDLERLKREGRLAWVDGVGGIFLPETKETDTAKATIPEVTTRPARTIIPTRGPAPGRGGPAGAAISTAVPKAHSPISQTVIPVSGSFTLRNATLPHLRETIKSALQYLHPGPLNHSSPSQTQPRTLLVLDTPSLLLAAHPGITPSSLSATIMTLHTLTTHILLHIPADDALLSLSTPPQPLEIDARNFLVKMAHVSERVLACRVLDTGVARDVSGVVRITGGRDGNGEEEEERGRGREFLYRVGGDGGVRVFERGAGG
ncbi:hypothetical protein B0J11DRAFT_485737 [Dendryphion nanum]|uniref:Elongator complex protein 6 n=1 Tax=Dendryphion nanum TaxID=256645 RepID=A0A9P9IPV2_9PLEO|nr:hypothetical protein B0J11DRAFT_485737 [Dendryphion nanum]